MEVELGGGGVVWCANSFPCQTQLSLVEAVLRLSWGCDNNCLFHSETYALGRFEFVFEVSVF